MSERNEAMQLGDIKDKATAKIIRHGMGMRLEASELATRADDLKAQANIMLEPFLVALDIESVVQPGVGRLSYFISKRASFDKQVAQDTLLAKGVPAKTIGIAFGKATKQSVSAQIRFKAENGE